MNKELTCVCCPIGCQLNIISEGDKITVTGNTCPRGMEYGIKEITAPTRVVTGSVRIINGELPLLSVKTAKDVPKDMIFNVMKEIHKCSPSAPVHLGETIISDVAGTGIDVIATRTVL